MNGAIILLGILAAGASPATGSVRGFIFSAGGTGIEGARVTAGPRVIFTDSEGSFFVQLPAGDVHFIIEAPGYPQVVTSPVPVIAGQQSEFMVVFNQVGAATIEIEAPDRPQTAPELEAIATTTISGKILSREKNTPIENARIFVRGVSAGARSTAEGTFSLTLPHGKFELTVIHPEYATANIPLEAGTEPVEVTISLETKAVELAEMVITAPALEGGTVFVLQERRESSTVTDVLGADQMSKSGDSDAAGALRRVTGVTVVGGRFVYVRGLGERYSATLLNDSTLPSPDPERRVVPLDLFPAGLLSGVEVQKTYSPNLPGEFGGGLVLLKTQDISEEFTAKIGLSGGYRLKTTGSGAFTDQTSGLEYLTFGAVNRDLPAHVRAASEASIFKVGSRFEDGYSPEELESFGEAMNLKYGRQPTTAPPDFGVSAEVGGGFRLFGYKAGAHAGASLSNDFLRRSSALATYAANQSSLVLQNNLDTVEELKHQAALAALTTLGLDLGEDQKLRAVISLNRLAENSTRFAAGFSEEDDTNVQITRLWWVEQMLLTNQLRGEHALAGGKLELDWRYMFSIATRDEPNRREIKYERDQATGIYNFSLKTSGNQRFYSELLDFNHDLGVDLTLPIALFGELESKLQAGIAGLLKHRRVDSRRYRYDLNGDAETRAQIRQRDPNSIFTPETIGPGLFELEEVTLPDDNYLGAQQLFAGYVQGDVAITDQLRILAGARLEYSKQKLETRSPIAAEGDNQVAGELANFDLLPAATLTWAFVEGMQLRAGFARTVNRPNFRELSPTRFFDVALGVEFRGNPDLERALLTHYDLRWEWYPSDSESVSAAVFAKTFENPIESSVEGGANWVFKPVNVEGARNFGVELDFRKNFEFIDPLLESLFLASNLTLVWSEVSLGDEGGIATSKERPLQGQSPHALNVQLGWDDVENETSLALLFNIFGRRIDSVGGLGVPDIYEEAFPSLDFVARKKLGRFGVSFKASNILDSEGRKSIDRAHFVERYHPRRTFSAGVSIELD